MNTVWDWRDGSLNAVSSSGVHISRRILEFNQMLK